MTLDDILNDEMFNQTETEKSLFNVSKLPNRKLNNYEKRVSTSNLVDFDRVLDMELKPFNGTVLIGQYFVLNGVCGFLVNKQTTRTEIYFENGTKSNMLYTSLISMMRGNGKLYI